MGSPHAASRSGRSRTHPATVDDLYRVQGQAEIVGGQVVAGSPTGFRPARSAHAIGASLREYERRTRRGFGMPSNAAYIVDLPNRRSFSPSASFYVGPPTGGQFMTGAPVFAAEVRGEGDYGPVAEKKIADKRADYFAAGTRVVWDVDVLRKAEVRVYVAERPGEPRVYGRGDDAEAEPALPGWMMPVDVLFE